jgi:hypothetical protein
MNGDPKCRDVEPATREILPKHWAACHHTPNFEQSPVTIPQLDHRREVTPIATEEVV